MSYKSKWLIIRILGSVNGGSVLVLTAHSEVRLFSCFEIVNAGVPHLV